MEGLKRVAQSGNIDALYAIIEDDPDVLRRIDQMEFVDTPLHMAAAAGQSGFAMEMMNLKPSFARKLNQRGLSPLHLALQNNNEEVVTDLLSIDKDLVRVKGRECYTPFHIVARDGNVPLLSQFLEQCPDCILDLTIRKETALHIAAQNEKLEAFEAILKWIPRNLKKVNHCQKRGILNFQDKEGNTVLHIAASKNETQMIKLLIKCKQIDRNVINRGGLTALDVVQQQTQVDNREIMHILISSAKDSHSWIFVPSSFHIKMDRDIKEMKPETINALLVVFTLILTMAYQALLNPPGGVFQGDASSNSTAYVGKSVMNTVSFFLFYIPNGIALAMASSITVSLISVVAESVMPFLLLIKFLMSICYGNALSAISRDGIMSSIVGFLPFMIFSFIYYPVLYRLKKQYTKWIMSCFC